MKIGIIGGSGLNDPKILENSKDEFVHTPYGKVEVVTGKISGRDVVLVSRHGKKHTIPPTMVNYRGNIFALKELGCNAIIATTAVGSLRRDIGRGDFVILDQFIDFTKHRHFTFHESFEPHKPIHTPMAKPFDSALREKLISTCRSLNLKHHETGTVITIEGPRFSTKAESKMFRAWGADVINMTIATETSLANETGIPYAAVAMSTDYDCLFDDVEHVTWEDVLSVFTANVDKVVSLIVNTVPKV